MTMSDSDFHQLNILSDMSFLKFVRAVYENNINNSILPDFDLDKKQQFVREIFIRLHSFDSNSINLCLKTLYLLTQERDGIDALTESSVLESLQKLSGLECNRIDVNPIDIRNAIEAEKCMSNLIYTSPVVQKFYSVSGVADAITQRIKETTETKLNDDIRFFDMRMLFLLTNFNPDIRQRIREKFHGLSYLFEIINQIMLFNSELLASSDSGITLSNTDIDYLIEILKTLSNLTVDLPNLTHSYVIQEEEEEAHLMRLVSILRELLLCYGPTDDKQIELRSHIINLLINMPTTCYEELLSPIVPEDENENDEHDGKNLDAINIILHFLDYQITEIEGNKNANEILLPVLQLLIFMCQSNRTIREFCRQSILPSISEEILNLPTKEQTLTDKLTSFMINSNSELKTLSTKLLFVLCKENVNRLIKYTGFENAGELLYDLGILNLQEDSNKDQYSSDSDEFDTENDTTIDDQHGFDSMSNPSNIELLDNSTINQSIGEKEKLLQLRQTNLNIIQHHSNTLHGSESSNNEDQIIKKK